MFMCWQLSEIIFFESLKSQLKHFFINKIYISARPRKVSELQAVYLTKVQINAI